jgi:hypothetical protein
MSKFKKFISGVLIFQFSAFWPAAIDHESMAAEIPEISSDTKTIVVNKVADLMKDYFLYPDVGEKSGEYIKAKLKSGDYDSFTDVKKFCSQVTADLREICHDKHLFVFCSPEEAKEVAARKGLLPQDEKEKVEKQLYEMGRRTNFGFSKVEILDGNVGYLDLRYVAPLEYAAETAIGAMKFLSHADAVIIDLRRNGGGGGIGHLLLSYFLGPERAHLIDYYPRASDEPEQYWSYEYVPGKRMPDVDLYFLTSSKTFSAAEELAFNMQQLKRAVIIGETTKGGAHPVDVLIVQGDILLQVSIGETVHPVTRANWEGVGVEPDVKVPAEDALQAAHLLTLKNLLDKTTDDEVRNELISLIEQME